MLLSTDTLEVIRYQTEFIAFHQRNAPADQSSAAANLGIGQSLERYAVAGEVTAEITATTAAWAPSVGTMLSGAGRKLPRASHCEPASNQ